MLKPILIAAAFLGSSLAGCAESTTQAPGTMPGDMSEEAHLQEAAKHETEATKHERYGAGQSQTLQKMKHSKEAAKHEDIADQHRKAAEDAK